MAVIGINYREGDKKNLSYESVEIVLGISGDRDVKLFNTGNFVKDWFDHVKWLVMNDISKKEFIMHSSSVDHFLMDGAPYDSAWLQVDENDVTSLVYDYDAKHLNIELFVPEGTKPTWEELKEICK